MYVFFDFRKASNSVPHAPLMQSVVVNGSIADPVLVLSGVPQQSVLGPSTYINDLLAVVSNLYSNVNLFADDILLYHLITDAMDYVVLQEVITLLGDWSLPTT